MGYYISVGSININISFLGSLIKLKYLKHYKCLTVGQHMPTL